ncbi:aspartate aminotransferase family protein [Acetivibrio straminisolvens]|jgi:glutamate-1-semialdehyde 2,1-aminomutase|uniref:Glutamate-1-semialdehyde aminotransferase n=1 Tax=Acetivibrio straminisolvens JCM 21531 TaxID=1294263 RepID=W4V396_9FIRM|nr:aminotransferase class III-fold pyridoxal phosphate-dependent enzyme [Acetivibrio straminisolvens]GAE87602.1 glutamate-1-semialdehyde aminotransferase [Acetivibrio straminisolvens JCM 21531]
MKSQQNPASMKEYNLRVKKYLPGGVHYNFRLPWEETPIHFVKADGSRAWDMDGNEYLDLYARFGAMIVGHGNKEYNECLKETIDRVLSVSHCDMDAEALELIAKFIPSAEMIRFGLSGTEIVQNALRLARAWTGKNRFVRFIGHYHGNADNIMGGRAPKTGDPIPSDYVGDLKGTDGRAKDSMESQSYLIPWNNADILENLLKSKGHEIAAVITEPVCVNGGSVLPAPGYLKRVRELCDEYNVVLIFDEIITGFRMGLGGAQQEYGVTPDLTTLGKAIAGGGVPVSALVGKKEIMQLLVDKKVIHAGTFNGYPLGTAAVKATLEILSRNNGQAISQMNEKMVMIHEILKSEADNAGLPLVIQGPPGCASYHVCKDVLKNPEEYDFEIMSLDIILNNSLLKNGILVSSISRMYPNISLNEDDVEWFRERVRNAVIETKEIYDEIV